ncbi:MAG: hypothetical protein ABSD13_02925 [Candidatus Korobacteraceae bacterium]|jgi:hypothetical protein
MAPQTESHYISMTVSNAQCSAQHFGSNGLPCQCNETPVWELLHSSGQSVQLCEYHIECFWNMWPGFREAIRGTWPIKLTP